MNSYQEYLKGSNRNARFVNLIGLPLYSMAVSFLSQFMFLKVVFTEKAIPKFSIGLITATSMIMYFAVLFALITFTYTSYIGDRND